MNVFAKLLVGTCVLFAASGAWAQNVDGVLRVVKGDVQIKSAKTGQTAKARIGAKVYPKDIVITGKDARAKIVMVDNNEINVSPESQIEIQHYEFDPNAGKKEVLLNVIYGKVRSKVEQKYDGKTSRFQVKTPSAVAGVRGTDFITAYDRANKTSQVVTFHGAVEFGTPGPGGTILNAVSVTPGKTATSLAGGHPGQPADLPKSDLAKMDNDTKNDGPGVGTGGQSDRQPSNDGRKDGDKKPDGQQGSDKNGDKRGPASLSPTGGKDVGFDASRDSAACPTCNPPPPVIDQGPPPPPRAPVVNQPNTCSTCNQLIQNGKTNVNVRIK